MALGADDVKAAKLDDFLVLLFGFLGKLRIQLPVKFSGFLDFVRHVFVVANRFFDDFIGVIAPAHFVLCHKLGVSAQKNIGTASGHVGGNGNRALLTGLRNDFGFAVVELGVQNHVLYAASFKKLTDIFALFNRNRTDQNRLARGMTLFNLVGNRFKLALHGRIDGVVQVLSDHRTVGGNGDDVEPVNAPELVLFGLGSTRHAGDFFVHAEIVLEGNGSESLAFALDLHVLLGFNRLMEAVGIAAASHEAAREFIDDDHLAILDHVVNVPFHKNVGAERGQNVVMKLRVLGVGQVFDIERRLGLTNAFFGQNDGFFLFVSDIVIVLALAKTRNKSVRHLIKLGGFVALAGNDERGSGFVD